MKSIYWFRNDLRLNDNLTLNDAIESSDELLFIYIQDTKNSKETEWKFSRMGRHRRSFISQGLSALSNKLSEYGHSLNYYSDDSLDRLLKLVDKFEIDRIYCESIDAYEELVEEKKLRQHKIDLHTTYQSGLYLTDQIPFSLDELPDVFTSFRKQIELKKVKPNKPLSINERINRIKSIIDEESITFEEKIKTYANSSFPISENRFSGGEDKGFAYLESYFSSNKPSTYKKTRNELMGIDFSTKLSPWLACGYISARQAYDFLLNYEENINKNESTYWIFFELLWREYFRLIFKKYGKKIFHKHGLGFSEGEVVHSPENFELWREGKTSSNFINAGMKELNGTGFLSNRMRQIVASFLVNELACDWRAGAAWFESQLIDYDVFSNQCNWAYIAGYGTDPRGGRHFNIHKQKATYDPNNLYQELWC